MTTDDLDQLRRLRRAIVRTVEIRENYVAQRNLDPAFSFADANWRPPVNDYTTLYSELRDCPVDRISDSFRRLTRNFTGYVIPDTILYSDPWLRRWRRWTRGLPRRYWFEPLPLPGERGIAIDGVIVNHDTYAYQERINLLLPELQRLEKLQKATVLEIGGGYGALALAIKRIVPNSHYVICDLPESLLFSGLYLSLAGYAPQLFEPDEKIARFEKSGVVLLPNYLFPQFGSEVRLDLAINTLSMSEMSKYQVHYYAEKLSQMLGERGVFFEQNQDNRHLGMLNAAETIAPHFRQARKARWRRWWGPSRRPSQGAPHIWSN